MEGEDCEQNLCDTPITDHHFRIVEEKEEENKTKNVKKKQKDERKNYKKTMAKKRV